jgi:hypothetical protein
MRGFLGFAIVLALVIGLMAWGGAVLFFPKIGDEGVRAIITSAGVAFSVQLLTFGVMRFFAPTNVMAGAGMAMIVRFLTLAFHGFAGAPLLGLPMGAALVSLAAFFFVTSLIEPFFLGRPAPTPSTTK